jgi:hypothetical protein
MFRRFLFQAAAEYSLSAGFLSECQFDPFNQTFEDRRFFLILRLLFGCLRDTSLVEIIQKNCKEQLEKDVLAADVHRVEEQYTYHPMHVW